MQGLGVRQESVSKDLLLYKGILSKMTAAKEMMAEVYARDKRKQAERDAAKAAAAEPVAEAQAEVPAEASS
jgi:D-arabinose 1-dehydrogenase-like Zn-dependent alcohol dehydrogenase